MVKGRPIIPDQRTAIVVGAVCVFVGTLLLFDGYERRGQQRPFLLRIVPGL